MRAWRERNAELAALFNPAFCGIILHTGIAQYQKHDERGMPFPLVFLLLPVALSSNLRMLLPSTARTPLHLWLAREPQLKIRLPNRVMNLEAITRESVLFLIYRQRLALVGDRVLKSKSIRGLTRLKDESSELADFIEGARIIGNMFGKVGDAQTIFTSLGINI